MTAITDQTIATRIDAACRAQGITTTELAKRMSCGVKKARSLRDGQRGRILVADVIAAARVLNVPLERLVRNEDNAPKAGER